MLNQQALDSLYSATYLEDYLDCMENLPDDIQRYISRMRDLDIEYSGYMEELEATMEAWIVDFTVKKEQGDTRSKLPTIVTKKKLLQDAQKALMKAQDIGDEKLQLAQNVQDNVENKSRQLELDKKNLGELTKLRPREYGRELENQENAKEYAPPDRSIKRQRRAKHEVFVPSILGPSTLEVTSFIDSNIQDSHPLPTPTKSNQNYTSSTMNLSLTNINTYIKTEPKAGPSSHMDIKPDLKPSGRGSERAATGSTRGSGVDRGDADPSMQGRNSERTSNAAITSSVTPKRQTQKLPTGEKKYKRRKAKQTRNNEASPPDPIDPDEPTYCLCDQVSYGEMIGCDNDLCPIEWFHFSCVTLVNKPKGKWYCPKCRGDKPNIMKSKALFLKELEKYNREKEEKA